MAKDKKDKKKKDQAAAADQMDLPVPAPRMRQRYRDEVLPKLREQFGLTNPMQAPTLEKIIITVGMGKSLEGTKLNTNARETVLDTLSTITGQKAVITRAKKSVSNFKVRAGMETGAMVTLRRERMWEFFDRLISLAIPRIKDFRGLSDKSFDGRGNYSFGLVEQGVFPEINMAEANFTHGMNVSVVFAHSDDAKSRFVLQELGMPFVRPEEQN